MQAVIKEDCYGKSLYSCTNGIFFKQGDIVKVIFKRGPSSYVQVCDGRRFYVENSFLMFATDTYPTKDQSSPFANTDDEKDNEPATTSKIKSDGGLS